MSAPTLYQHYKCIARMIEFRAEEEAIRDETEAALITLDAVAKAEDVRHYKTGKPCRVHRVAARLSARAIRIARRELAACRV